MSWLPNLPYDELPVVGSGPIWEAVGYFLALVAGVFGLFLALDWATEVIAGLRGSIDVGRMAYRDGRNAGYSAYYREMGYKIGHGAASLSFSEDYEAEDGDFMEI